MLSSLLSAVVCFHLADRLTCHDRRSMDWPSVHGLLRSRSRWLEVSLQSSVTLLLSGSFGAQQLGPSDHHKHLSAAIPVTTDFRRLDL